MARPRQIALDLGGNGSPEWVHGPISYDGSGNITTIGVAGKRFAYDGVGRLKAFENLAAGFDETYQFDRWGNMTQVTRNGMATTFAMAAAGGVPSTNRLQSVTVGSATVSPTYDARGNLTHLPAFGADQRGKSFFFSAEDRLLDSTDTATGYRWRFAYDAAGERVARWHREGEDTDVEISLRDEGGAVVAEWRHLAGVPTLDLTREYVGGPSGPLAQLDYTPSGAAIRYLASDHLGSTRVMFDSSGLIQEYDFLPFGGFAPWADDDPDTTHLFTGHERDLGETNTGLDYMHARYYSSGLGRFLSVDPVGGKVDSGARPNETVIVCSEVAGPDGRGGVGEWRADRQQVASDSLK